MPSGKQHTSPLESVLKGRRALVELAGAAIVLALGVEFAASGLAAWLSLSPQWIFLLAVALIGLGGLLFFWRVLALRNYSAHLQGMFVCTKQDKLPISVPEYRFGDGLAAIFKAGFAENPALESQWRSGAPGSLFCLPGPGQQDATAAAKAAKLVEEAVEYFVLESLSTHLTDYFNRIDDSPNRTDELRREQVPEILLANRFLALFSAPMEDRPAFMQEINTAPQHGQIVEAFSMGARYSWFDLVLPKRSKVTRTETGAIEISTPRLRLTLAVRYEGLSAGMPFEFCRLYLQTPPDKLHAQMVVIDVDASVKPLGLFIGKWNYYRWVDSFISTLDGQVSFEGFLERVRWSTIAALFRCRPVGDLKKGATGG